MKKKAAAKNRSKSGRFAAGSAAASKPVAEALPVAELLSTAPLEIHVPEAAKLLESADALNSAAKSLLESIPVPDGLSENLLHRRVVYAVYDAAGKRLAGSSHDLTWDEVLTLTVRCDLTRAETSGSRA
jgi:hypothetical protein